MMREVEVVMTQRFKLLVSGVDAHTDAQASDLANRRISVSLAGCTPVGGAKFGKPRFAVKRVRQISADGRCL